MKLKVIDAEIIPPNVEDNPNVKRYNAHKRMSDIVLKIRIYAAFFLIVLIIIIFLKQILLG